MSKLVNISIDDITPHPHSSFDVLDRCYELIEFFPDIKFTLFMPMAYYRTMPLPSQSMCEEPLYIDLFPDFCDSSMLFFCFTTEYKYDDLGLGGSILRSIRRTPKNVDI